MELGKIEKVNNLRSIWKNEARDFTNWLAEEANLQLLADTIGIDLSLIGTESSVGSFRTDIYAEDNYGQKVVIENQLEDSNHEHAGKVLTYAAGKDAKTVIWIVKRAREEHRKLFEWLNNYMPADINFFLIEIELWKVDNSLPAPKFSIVEQPNNWAKLMKNEFRASEKFYVNYWTKFNEFASKNGAFNKEFSLRSPKCSNHHELSLGKAGVYLSMGASTSRNEIYISIIFDCKNDLYAEFQKNSKQIEKDLNLNLKWNLNSSLSCVSLTKKIELQDESKWEEYFNWYIDLAFKFKEICKKYGVL